MKNYTAIYSTKAIEGINYSFKAENDRAASEYCKNKFSVEMESITCDDKISNTNPSTALEIAAENYGRFEDKIDITRLVNALLSVESYYAKRDENGNTLKGFEEGVFEAVAQTMRHEFVSSKRCSIEVREFCVEIIKEMKY